MVLNFSSFSSSENHYEKEINAISYSAYRIIKHRFLNSPGYNEIINRANNLMSILGLDINNLNSENYSENSIALGNYIAENYIQYGLLDGSMNRTTMKINFIHP